MRTVFIACPRLEAERDALLAYRSALLILFPNGSNIRDRHARPGTIARVNQAFKDLARRHQRRLERFRCTIDRLAYIDHTARLR